MPPTCRICNNTEDNAIYHPREMMFGTREIFDYFQCGQCGCLQIADIPTDLARHYPSNYFSFKKFGRSTQSPLRGYFDRHRVMQGLGQPDWIGRFASLFAKPLNYVEWLKKTRLDTHASILDVGCGRGKLLLRMCLGGIRDCTGVDPFLTETVRYDNGVTIHKTSLTEFAVTSSKKYDLIMFHHSLEHMENPAEMLESAAHLLSSKGSIMVRIPVADCYAWEHYGIDWMPLDAPRHLHLLSQKSMQILVERAGMHIWHVEYDSTIQQFTHSELYRQDIPLNAREKDKHIFSRAEISVFKQRAEQLNLEQRGDQAVFFLSLAGTTPQGR
jgi:SAM-dependent methyltransferase